MKLRTVGPYLLLAVTAISLFLFADRLPSPTVSYKHIRAHET